MPRYGDKNFHGNKNSGRKTDKEIVAKYVNLELANKIADRELKRIDDKGKATLPEMKVVVMPVVLKNMADKKEISGELNINKVLDGLE
jgi:hypothetical protein